MLPSSRASSTPVTVTVCAMFQLAAVKVSVAGATVPSPVSLEVSGDGHVRGRLGGEHHREGGGAAPASVVVSPVVGVTVMPAASLSVLVTLTSAGVDPGVVGVAAGGRGGDDRVARCCRRRGVVDAGDRHRLRRVPVGGGEGERRPALTVPSVVSLELRPMVTSAVGCGVEHDREGGGAGRASVVVSPEVGVTMMPAVSSSVLRDAHIAGVEPGCSWRRRWWPRR